MFDFLFHAPSDMVRCGGGEERGVRRTLRYAARTNDEGNAADGRVSGRTRLFALAHVGQVLLAFLEQLLALGAVNDHAPDAAQDVFGAEIEFVVKLFHRVKDLGVGEVRVVDDAFLVTAFVQEAVRADPALLLAHGVEFGAGVGGGQRGLDRVEIQHLGVFNGFADGLPGFAGQTHDEGAVDGDAQLLAVPGELDGLGFGDTLFDIFQDLLIAALVADHDMTQSGFTHDLEGIVIAVGAGVDCPGDAQRLDQFGHGPGVFLVGAEGVVVKREFAHLGDVVHDPLDLFVHVLRAAGTHALAGKGLGPEAVDAAGRTAAAGIDRDVGVLEVRDDIFADRQIALVDRRHEGQGIQVLDHGAIRGVDHLAILHETETIDRTPGPAFAEFLGRVVEFTTADDIDGTFAGAQRFLRQD